MLRSKINSLKIDLAGCANNNRPKPSPSTFALLVLVLQGYTVTAIGVCPDSPRVPYGRAVTVNGSEQRDVEIGSVA